MRKLAKIALTALVVATIAGAASALASGVSAPVADCNLHGRLTRHYSDAELQNALNTMPSDIKEYSDCYDVIESRLLTQLGQTHAGGGSDSGSTSSFLPTPVIIAIVVLALAAVALGGVALARRRPPGA